MIRRPITWRVLFALATMVTAAAFAEDAAATERILSFDQEITVSDRGRLTIIETIKVVAEGRKIRRGIYRDFPTTYEGTFGIPVTVPFEVASVTWNGAPATYGTSRVRNGVRVKIGSPERLLPPGEHVYAITYETGRQLGIFENHDELYWNVTGNGWDFAIDRATATVHLPTTVPLGEVFTEGYTGRKGSTDITGFEASVDEAAHVIRYRTTQPLGPREGLTIIVSFPKGHVAAPTLLQQIFDDRVLLIGLPLFLLVLGYYLVAWLKVGVDPATGTIIPEYEPPLGLSPAATRHVWQMGFDQKCVTAALLGLAQRGEIDIVDDGGVITLERKHDLRGGPIGERKVKKALLKDLDSLELENTNHDRVGNAITLLSLWLKEEHEGKLFLKNRKWLLGGVVLTIAALAVTLLGADFVTDENVLGLTAFLSVWTIGTALLVSATVAGWRGPKYGSKKKPYLLTGLSVVFVIGELIGLFLMMQSGSLWMGPLLILTVGTNVLFFFLMKAPTGPGRRVMDKIEGLRMYLGTAEQDRLEATTAWRSAGPEPEKTVERFERFLPYAVALGVENTWADRFASVLAAASQADGRSYQPSWYHGAFSVHRLNTFTSSVSSGLSSAISSSATAPGTSSGSSSFGGGGGFSGGGGGGGGGGGW